MDKPNNIVTKYEIDNEDELANLISQLKVSHGNVPIIIIKGPKGCRGNQGDQGDQGNPGIQGNDGIMGPPGSIGMPGERGPTGISGNAKVENMLQEFNKMKIEIKKLNDKLKRLELYNRPIIYGDEHDNDSDSDSDFGLEHSFYQTNNS